MAGNHNVLQSYVDPRASALQNQIAGMSPAQKYLFAMAHRISPNQFGLSPQQINYYEQGLTGYHMNPQTGQITQANAMGGQTPVDPSSLMSTANTNMGGNVAGSGELPSTPGYNMTGYADNGASAALANFGGGGGGVSNIGGGLGNPNNAAGLGGSAGNALRQMFMDSDQFNHNGANTYAIQNMNLTGQGGLGSQMGGMASNGMFGQPTAVGSGATSTTPISDPSGYAPRSSTPFGGATPGPTAPSAPAPYQQRTTTPYQTSNTAVSPAPSGSGTSMTPRYFTNPTQFQMPSSKPADFTGTKQQYTQQYGTQQV